VDFGLTLPNFHYGATPTREHILAVARAAEESGFTSVWASDHILVGSAYPRYGTLYEALATLAWVAAKTASVRVGTSILVLPMRHALLAAKQIATIDNLTAGRVVVGLGAGWIKGEFELVGANFSRRGRVLDESIRAMRALWTQERPSFAGEYYRFDDALFFPKPAQAGGPPIWIGGNSDAALQRTAALGDAWHADEVPPGEFETRVATLNQLAAAAGRRVSVTIRYTVDMNAAMGKLNASVTAANGAGGDMKGSFDGMRSYVDRYRKLGATDFICQFEHQTPEQHVDFIRAFGREIIQSR
jgi:probable F420-dependent oxidoreductase